MQRGIPLGKRQYASWTARLEQQRCLVRGTAARPEQRPSGRHHKWRCGISGIDTCKTAPPPQRHAAGGEIAWTVLID